jgi:KaiC/GvpD/RAD55 family RecA-like ATPase
VRRESTSDGLGFGFTRHTQVVQSSATLHALQRVEKRAERASDERLVQTYVETGPLLHTLQQTDNALIFGRRGTGKTHTLKFLAERLRSDGHLAIYIDMERLGSTGGIYNDPGGLPMAQRATRLLVDVLNELQDKFVDAALELEADAASLALCDALARSANEVVVMGETEVESSAGLETEGV